MLALHHSIVRTFLLRSMLHMDSRSWLVAYGKLHEQCTPHMKRTCRLWCSFCSGAHLQTACAVPYNHQVDLYENGTIAIVEAVSPELGNRVQRVRVQLPGTSSELLQKFREKKIDFAAHSNTEDGSAVFLNLLGNLAFPLLLVGGLFLLSRRSGGAGGMGGPGGNNPMAFGKSKARFQMEPNTGVTFSDVAGGWHM